MTTKDNSFDFIAVTQASMAEALATQGNTLADISKTLAKISVDQGKMEERIISIFENNQRIETTLSRHGAAIRNLENVTNVNKFARQFAPRMFFSLVAAVGVGASVVYAVFEVAGKG